MKKILFIFEDGRFGGPHSQFLNILDSLSKKINVYVLFPKQESKSFDEKLRNKKVTKFVINIKYLSIKFSILINYIFFFIFDIFKIIKVVSKNNFDFICVYTGTYSLRSIIAAKILNKKIIWYIHDTYDNFFNRIIFKYFSNDIYLVVFSSNKSKSNYLKGNKQNLNHLVLQSVINFDEFKYNKKIKSKVNKKIKILAAGNFSPVKNFELFLKIAKLNTNNINFKFNLVGNTWNTQIKYRRKILFLKNKYNLKNLSIINKKNLKNYLDNSDYFFCTSKSESSSVLILEAIKSGCIIFSTHVGDMNININKYKFGFMINEKKLVDIGLIINNIEKNNKLKKKLILNGYRFLKKEHDISMYLSKFLKKLKI